MDIIKIILNARPNLKPQSANTYLSNLRRIAGTRDIEDMRFLTEPDEIFKRMDGMKLTMKRNILSSILVLLSALHDSSKELYTIYSDKLLQFSNEYKREMNKNEKTETQKENWTSIDVLSNITKKMLKDNPGSQNSLIGALYTMQPPQRLDYYDMEIVGPKDELKENKNYLVIGKRNKKTFVFNDYKSSNKYNTVKIPVNKKINSVINKFLKLNPDRKYLLVNKQGDPMTRNNLGKQITKIFASTGKHIKLNLIRHMYVSENIDLGIAKKNQDISQQMMHSPSIQLEYAKN
ncbi:MAG: Uncharacterised protein [Owenweeksia sp. TMED14]|nr:MAG: Uncharacterised protein [Owenweeksia sp. TMED14]